MTDKCEHKELEYIGWASTGIIPGIPALMPEHRYRCKACGDEFGTNRYRGEMWVRESEVQDEQLD